MTETPLVPRSAKRARIALALAFIGAVLLFVMQFLLLLLFFWGGRNSSTVPLFGREVSMDLIAAPFVFGSAGCSLAGFLIGATTRKTGDSKAFAIGGATLLVWLLIAGAIGKAMFS